MAAVLEQEQALIRSAVDEEFRALVTADPQLFGLGATEQPAPVDADLHAGLAVSSMADIDIQACDNTCSWGFTQLCDKFTN